jgi:hypothetical protein
MSTPAERKVFSWTMGVPKIVPAKLVLNMLMCYMLSS